MDESLDQMVAAPVIWGIDRYVPYAMEFDTLQEWRYALRAAQAGPLALRLTKYAQSEICGTGALLPLASYRLELDDVATTGLSCCCCGQPLGETDGLASAGTGLHRACLPGRIRPDQFDLLLLFAEELTQRRSVADVLGMMPARKKGR